MSAAYEWPRVVDAASSSLQKRTGRTMKNQFRPWIFQMLYLGSILNVYNFKFGNRYFIVATGIAFLFTGGELVYKCI